MGMFDQEFIEDLETHARENPMIIKSAVQNTIIFSFSYMWMKIDLPFIFQILVILMILCEGVVKFPHTRTFFSCEAGVITGYVTGLFTNQSYNPGHLMTFICIIICFFIQKIFLIYPFVIKKYPYLNQKYDNMCPICRENYINDESLIVWKCGHHNHNKPECYNPETMTSCSMCRFKKS
jgi:hypothetical protein